MKTTQRTRLTREEAISRFEQNLGDAAPSRQDDPQWWEKLDEIVAQIDGVPLTIDQLSVAILETNLWSVHARLKNGLGADLLDARAWDLDWEALDESQQKILNVACCFRGGFDQAAIEQVMGESVEDGQLDDLEQRGLLERVLPYQNVFTIWWPGRTLLQEYRGDASSWHRRHGTYFVERFDSQDDRVIDDFEVENLWQAAQWGLKEDVDLAAKAALCVCYATRQYTPFMELIELLSAVRRRRACQPGDVTGIEVLGRLGEFYRIANQFEQSIEVLELALALQPPNDHFLYGGLRLALSLVLSYTGRFERARLMAEQARQAYEAYGKPHQVESALAALGTLYVKERDYAKAATIFDELVTKNPESVAMRSNLGAVYSELGDAKRALPHLEIVIEETRKHNHARSELIALNNLTTIELYEDKRAQAEAQFKRLGDLYEVLGSKHQYRLLTLLNKALYALKYGSLLDAYHFLSQGLTIDAKNEDVLAMRACVAAYLGEFSEASEMQELLQKVRAPGLSSHHEVHVSFGIRCGRLMHDRSEDVAALLEQVEAHDREGQGCLIRALFDDLAQRVAFMMRDDHILKIGHEFKWAQVGVSEQKLDLSRSFVSRQLLGALITQHQDTPGSVCSIEVLFDAAWPGQVWNTSARTRLHTAIHRLRERLLGDLLVTHSEQGYSLISTCQLIF